MIAGDTPRNMYNTVLRAIGGKGGGGFSTHHIRRGVGLKSQGMSVAVIPMMCLGNRLCRRKL